MPARECLGHLCLGAPKLEDTPGTVWGGGKEEHDHWWEPRGAFWGTKCWAGAAAEGWQCRHGGRGEPESQLGQPACGCHQQGHFVGGRGRWSWMVLGQPRSPQVLKQQLGRCWDGLPSSLWCWAGNALHGALCLAMGRLWGPGKVTD